MTDHDAAQHTNRLIQETSPYLLQHAHNPVDWYPWGPEAFERARAEDKPILLSIGYAACHWCHVMAHESFENEDTARLINERFVAIKVDREERPDVDALYMDAVQALTGGGGWPMTVFLTPDGAPFYGGTYFPPADRYGMPGFSRVLRTMGDLYATRRDDVERQAEEFRRFYRERGEARVELPADLVPAHTKLDPALLDEAAQRLLPQFDTKEGGFGRAPKFPHPMVLEFLLRVQSRWHASERSPSEARSARPGPRLMELVRLTLDKMAGGGIYDQIGGGFHRYSTDERWLVPHFEKMLYDNALLAPVYLHAWQLTGEERYRRVCEGTLDYVLREMTDESGGFYSTQDADSEGEEGKFYVWTPAELHDALGDADAAVVERVWGVTETGNFEGRNILHVARPPVQVAAELGREEDTVRDILARARERLYGVRAQRVWPVRDDKVLAAWNGLMLRALAEAGRALDRRDFLDAALRTARFLRERMVVDGRLRRSWRQGQAKLDAYLEDYAAVVNGLLSAYEATGDVTLCTAARELSDSMLERFWDGELDVFFDTAYDQEQLIGRPRELTDNATPSGTSLAAEALLRLSALTGEERYRDRAARILLPLVSAVTQQPSAFGHLLCALDDFIGPFYEIALAGSGDELSALAHSVFSHYLPRAVTAMADAQNPAATSSVPLLEGRVQVDGHAAAYVCQGFVCRQPVTTPEALAQQLGE